MRTSLNEIKNIEQYLHGNMSINEKGAFEARVQRDQSFNINVFLQQKLYRLLPFYQRRRIKEQADQLHHRLFNHPDHAAFRESIFQLF